MSLLRKQMPRIRSLHHAEVLLLLILQSTGLRRRLHVAAKRTDKIKLVKSIISAYQTKQCNSQSTSRPTKMGTFSIFECKKQVSFHDSQFACCNNNNSSHEYAWQAVILYWCAFFFRTPPVEVAERKSDRTLTHVPNWARFESVRAKFGVPSPKRGGQYCSFWCGFTTTCKRVGK